MRIGVVGTGSIGRRHIGNLLALGAEVVAMDILADARSLAEREYPNARYVPAIPLKNIDALVIATPYDNHLGWVEECVKRSIPFFVEKPLGSLEQLPRWREIAAMELPINQVGYMLRFHPNALAMRNLQPFSGRLVVKWDGSKYQHSLLESSHEIDLAVWMAAAGTDIVRVINGSIYVGIVWRIDIDSASKSYFRSWSVDYGRQDRTASYECHSPEELGVEMYRDELAHFLECVREQKPTICPLADGLRVLEVCATVEAMRSAA